MFARIALSFAMVAVVAGTAQAQTSRLMGQVSYPDRVQLGKTAVLEVTLEDVSDATGAGVVIATLRMPKPGQSPVIFSMEYDAARVKPSGRYALRVHIVDAGARLLETATPVRVLTQGVGSTAIVTLVPVVPTAAAPKPAPESKATPTPKPTLEPKTVEAPKPKPEPKSTPAPKPTPEPKAVAAPKPAPEPKATPAPKPTPEPKAVATPKPKPEPKATPAPKPTPEPKKAPEPKSTPAPKAAAEPTTKPAPVPKSTPTPAPAPSTKVAPSADGLSGIAWTIVEIDGKPVGSVDKDQRQIMLAFDANRRRFSGTSGCNDLAGRFAKNGAPLTPTSDKSSPICRVDEQTERAMRSVIQVVRGYRVVSGTTLELLDEKGACLAKLER